MFRFFRRATAPDPQPGSQLVESAPSNADAAAPTITESLGKTRGGFFGAVRNLFRTQVTLDEAFWESLEERLIAADLGAHVTADLVDELRARNGRRPFASGDEAEAALRELLEAILGSAGDPGLTLPVDGAAIILVIGVNGTGKTTTVAKLTKYLLDGGRKPHLIAGDTFRAAAIDQLAVWAERTGVPMYGQVPGSDPAAVVFDGIGAAVARGGRSTTGKRVSSTWRKFHSTYPCPSATLPTYVNRRSLSP